jgi:hypothetical protein
MPPDYQLMRACFVSCCAAMPWLAIKVTADANSRAALEALQPLLPLLKQVLDHMQRGLPSASSLAKLCDISHGPTMNHWWLATREL